MAVTQPDLSWLFSFKSFMLLLWNWNEKELQRAIIILNKILKCYTLRNTYYFNFFCVDSTKPAEDVSH